MSLLSFIVLSVVIVFPNFSSSERSHPSDLLPNGRHYSLTVSNKRLIETAGFDYEYHQAKTDDGYLIGLHRIVRSGRPTQGHPVLMVNGFCVRSRSWILRGKGIDFPFILADLGYDVWLGDQRGNPYSRKHLKYSFHDKEYWDFSSHEIGVYDLPAMIDKVLNETSQNRLSFVGQSLASSFYFTMVSEREDHNRKIASSIHFVPLVIPPDVKQLSSILRLIIQFVTVVLKWVRRENMVESHSEYLFDLFARIVMVACDRSPLQNLCVHSLPWTIGGSMKNFDQEHVGYQMGASIGLTSFKTCEHLVQMYHSGKFRKYDYGSAKNFKLYGHNEPPEYNISKVSSPTAIFFAEKDGLVPYQVSTKTIAALGKYARPFLMKGFNHFEMALGRKAITNGYAKAANFLNEVVIKEKNR